MTILSTGGTIAMAGARATPALDVDALLATIPALADVPGLRARGLLALPGAHLTAADALTIAGAALEQTRAGRGVVITHGTDTLEETAVLCDVLHGGFEPIVLTGAIRPSSAAGADGPANLLDAVAAAGSARCAGVGAVVVFGGELHAARAVRKVASLSPAAFGSPGRGALGTVAEGRVRLTATPLRQVDALSMPAALDARVPIVPTYLGDVSPPVLAALREAAAAVPVALTVRPEHGVLAHETYGFEGAEGDLRASGALPAAALSPQAARMVLLAGLGGGCPRTVLARALDL